MSIRWALYWLVTGATLGFGFIGILSIGLPFLVVGLLLAIFGGIRSKGTGLWAGLVGFGGLAALILLWDVTQAPWACQNPGGPTPPPNVNIYSCVDTYFGQLTTYHVLALGFGVVALLGLLWPLLCLIRRRPQRRAAS